MAAVQARGDVLLRPRRAFAAKIVLWMALVELSIRVAGGDSTPSDTDDGYGDSPRGILQPVEGPESVSLVHDPVAVFSCGTDGACTVPNFLEHMY